jgi:type IV pilus assembly protein PilW
MKIRCHCSVPHRLAGLTLIELLVALVMGLVLMAGVVTVFVSNKQTYQLQDAMSRLQENGRLALLLLERDLRNAGAGSCLKSVTKVQNMLNTPSSFPAFMGPPITGADSDRGQTTWVPPLDKTTNYFGVTPVNGTDIVTIRGGENEGIRVTKQPGWTTSNKCGGSNMHTTPRADICKFDIIMVTDCRTSAVMQATSLQNNSGQLSVVGHNTGVGTPGNSTHCVDDYYAPPNQGEIIRLNLRTYFVGDNGRGGTSLYRAGFRRPGNCGSVSGDDPQDLVEELVEGVEDMQILYGVDDDGDEAVEKYQSASEVTDWNQVVSVRVSLLLQSIRAKVLPSDVDQSKVIGSSAYEGSEYYSWNLGSLTDSRLRQTYTVTVAVRNKVL